jgi:hypothetical protein
MATETRYFSLVSPSTPNQIVYEDLGYAGNNQDQLVIQTDGVSSFALTINDDAITNGGNYAAAFLITITGETTAPQTFAYIDFTTFAFAEAAQELADYYASLGYIVYDDDAFLRAVIQSDPGEQFTVTISGTLHDDAAQFRGGSAHPISYTAQVSEVTAADQGLNYGTDFRDVNPFSALGDFFDGRGDLDVITFQSPSSAYQIGVQGDSRSVVNGVDLINTERLEFSDYTLALDLAGTAGQVYRLYQAAFDRQPDLAGLSYNVNSVDNGMNDIRSMAQYFSNSAEFRALYGPNISNAEYTDTLYTNVLGRSPDAGGYQYWNTQLNSGLSRGEMLLLFSDSDENVALIAPQIDGGIWLS